MLRTLQVRNYAVVADTSLELGPGMTVLSGETGAGKSIVVGALGLVLGDRADAGIVRDGAERTEVSAHFEASEAVAAWLQEQALDDDGECLVRRLVSREGRSRAWINAHAVTLQTLRTLAAMLVDIHGQHAHQSLTKTATQRAIVDSFADNDAAVVEIGAAFEAWRAAASELERLDRDEAERDSRLDLARFQLGELQALAPQPGEASTLGEEQKRIAHAGQLADGVTEAIQLLSEEDGHAAQPLLARAAHVLAGLAAIDESLGNAAKLVAEAEIQVSEAIGEIGDYGSRIDMDPQRRDWVEQRLATMQTLARKHRIEPDALAARLDELLTELQQLEDSGQYREQLERRVAECRERYAELAETLNRRRRRAASKLDRAISTEIQQLGMTGGRFVTRIESDPGKPQAHGTDAIEFLVAANAGQQPRPMARVASGGELSRLGLAIEVLAARHQPVPTMVFDEVDSGVGGRVAEMVGQKLRQLGDTTQVLCVTHLAPVASQAHRHVLVAKHSDGQQTETRLVPLDKKQRIEEIARMLGGAEITAATRKHAREMLTRGASGRTPASKTG